MKKILLGILLLFISFGGYSQRAAEFKNGITIQKEEVLASKFVSYGESYITNWRDIVLDDGATYFPNNGGYEIGRLHQAEINTSLHVIGAAVKEGVLYSIGENRVNDFNVDRASLGTFVGHSRIITTADFDVARIDYTDGDGAILAEDESTNLIERSESPGHSYWDKSGATIEGDASTAGSDINTVLITNSGSGSFDYDNFSGASATGFTASVVSASGSYAEIQPSAGIIQYSIYLVTCDLTINSGTAPYIKSEVGATTTNLLVSGSNTLQIIATNGVLYVSHNPSETADFVISNISIKEVQGFSAPDGSTNAYKLVEDSGTSNHISYKGNVIVTLNATVTQTIYAKAAGRDWILLRDFDAGDVQVYFDLSNGVTGTTNGSPDDYGIEELTDGWYKCWFTATRSGSTNSDFQISLSTDGTDWASYTGDGTSGVYIFGAQLEEQSYATSYIKSDSGSSTTRLADEITGAGDVNTFNSVNSSGVLYVEMAAFADDSVSNRVSLNDGTVGNRIFIGYNTSNEIWVMFNVEGVVRFQTTLAVDITSSHKIAARWADSDWNVFVDGVSIGSQLSGATYISTFSSFDFNDGGGGNIFYGKVKDIKVLPYLDNATMIILTTQ